MSQKPIERVLASPSLPSLPAVALEVLELTADPNIQLPKLAKAVEHDPALAARILKTVNSSFYGLAKPCPTITRALAYLGMNTVKSLVLGFSLADHFTAENEADPYGFSYTDLWRGSLYGAAAARLIATEHAREVDPDEAFMAGLLQDIGMLAAASVLESEYTMVVGPVSPGDEEVVTREREILMFDHIDLGTALCKRWKLPHEIVSVIEHHHCAEEAPPELEVLTRCVVLGRFVAAMLVAPGEERGKARRLASATACEWFKIDGNEAADWFGRIEADCRALGKLFNVPADGMPAAASIVNEAHERLLEHQISMDQENDRLAREQDRLIHEALTDGLTNVANRKKFDMFLEESFATAHREDGPMAVILLDADKFKVLNDTLGHQAGDAVLIELAKRAEDCVPEGGLFARYGGEEFAVVLPTADAAEAGRVAEAIRKRICSAPFNLEDVPCKENSVEVSVSCGVSAREPGSSTILKSAATLLRAADKAVYAAKESGRNRVRVIRLKPAVEIETPAQAPPSAPAPTDAQPQDDPNGPETPDAAPEAPGQTNPTSDKDLPLVAIIEDDPLQLKLFSLPLEKSGEFAVATAGTAAAALEILGIEPESDVPAPSFILCDIGLPDMNGIRLVETIRQHPDYQITPIVILSSSELSSDVAAVMNAGANAFISKDSISDDPKRRLLDIAEFWSRMIPTVSAA